MNIKRKTLAVRDYVLRAIASNSNVLVPQTANHFALSRQSVSRHIKNMVDEGLIEASGNTKARKYSLRPLGQQMFTIQVNDKLQEDREWVTKIYPLLADLPSNVLEICEYGFTEMLNNVIDHSESETALVVVEQNALQVEIRVRDYGVGIFNKLQKDLGLEDPRHALLELAKGRVTSDEKYHTGEGIFFTSRMFDNFRILSGTLFYSRMNKQSDWLLENKDDSVSGTMVTMTIDIDARQTTQLIFSEHASEYNDYGFSRTVIPIELVKYEGQELVSRSQAKRLLARCDKFTEVVLDFKRVKTVGPAFADEIFRVYKQEHPKIRLIPINTVPDVEDMIKRAQRGVAPEQATLPL